MAIDYRTKFISEFEEKLLTILSPTDTDNVSNEMIKLLNDYELSPRETQLVSLDTVNYKVLNAYCGCLVVDGKSKGTICQYRRAIQKLFDFIKKPYSEIGVYDIRYFLATEKERGVSNRSLENTRANLSAFFQWLTNEEMIPKNIMLVINPIKYVNEIRKPFSAVEIDSMRGACKTIKERAIIELLLSSGIRVAELASMSVNDIDLGELSVYVRNGKGGKDRVTYMTDVAAKYIKLYISQRSENGECLLYNHKHEQMQCGGIRYLLNVIGERSGVTNVHPHRFRRTFATAAAQKGLDVYVIQHLLGHSNINTTMQYICSDDEKIKSSYRKYIT